MPDLSVDAFHVLRRAFFRRGGVPKRYRLRDKRNTQDDPLDERIVELLRDGLPADISCSQAPGPLITPDLALYRQALCDGVSRSDLRSALDRVIGIEVKKLERQPGRPVPRASGMDYNTTPPCGTVRVFDRSNNPLPIKGFYLFVCQEAAGDRYRLTALALCDGDLLNADFDLYMRIVGPRTKATGLGTYGDGADRQRPMLIFANPLGSPLLDHQVTLVHSRPDLADEFHDLRVVGRIRRRGSGNAAATFYCYRATDDVPNDHEDFDETDPFPTPNRGTATQGRGRFHLGVEPAD